MRIAIFILVTLACAHTPPRPDVVWPPPPDKPRIKFVTTFRSEEDLGAGGWARVRRALAGASNDKLLSQPMGLALSPDGQRLYIADYGLGSVVLADLREKTMQVFAPEVRLQGPMGVALDGDENVYVTETVARQVTVLSRDGKLLRVLAARELDRPTGIAIDRALRRIYLVDTGGRESNNHRVRAYGFEGTRLFDLGPREGPGGRGDGDGQFFFPNYVAVDKEGQVWVADMLNFRIQAFDRDGKFLKKFGEQGDGPGLMGKVKGIAFDGLGNLYEVDAEHAVVQVFNRRMQLLLYFGGAANLLEYFDVPTCIAIDPQINRIYVCNTQFARVNVYDLVNTTIADVEAAAK